MTTYFTSAKQKKVLDISKKILEFLHLKLIIYQIFITIFQEIALKRLRKIVQKSNVNIKNSTGKKIFLYTVGRYGILGYTEAGIAKSLQMRGNNVKMLICGGAMNMCTTHFTITQPFNPWICKNCISFSKKFFKTINLPFSTYNDYLEKKDIKNAEKKVNELSVEQCEKIVYKDIRVGFHAKISAERYFMGDIPPKDKYEKILRLELMNAIISTDVAEKIYENEKPDVFITSQGIYSSWGAFTDFFTNKKIRVNIWASGEGDTITFDRHKSQEYYREYYEEIRKKQQLNPEEEKEIEEFFNRRTHGKEGQVTYYNFGEVTKEELEDKFQFKKYDKTYVIFPNVPWDAAVLAANTAFTDVYEWILCTIELFKEKQNLQLIIKIHPSEIRFMESKRTLLDYIKNTYPTLPENIKIITGDTTISPYSLFPFIDVGIVYVGTIGLEMAVNNIPVVVAGDAHYNRKGFTYDALTKEEYSKILNRDLEPISNQQNLAKVYSYFHFIKKFIPKSFIKANSFLDIRWNIDSLEGFNPGKDKYLDHICNYIENNGVFQNW